MIKYRDFEIDVLTTNFANGCAIIPLPDGLVCLPEQDATLEELEIIQQIKDDVEARPKPEVVEVKPYFDEMTYLQANIVEVVVDNYNAIAGGIK